MGASNDQCVPVKDCTVGGWRVLPWLTDASEPQRNVNTPHLARETAGGRFSRG